MTEGGDPMTPEESIHRARANAKFTELADIYEYCYNNLEEWEKGEIEPTDLPHVGSKENDVFSEFTGAIILRSIAFGSCWEYHVPSDREDGSGGDSSSSSGGVGRSQIASSVSDSSRCSKSADGKTESIEGTNNRGEEPPKKPSEDSEMPTAGYRCPKCGSTEKPKELNNGSWQCTDCPYGSGTDYIEKSEFEVVRRSDAEQSHRQAYEKGIKAGRVEERQRITEQLRQFLEELALNPAHQLNHNTIRSILEDNFDQKLLDEVQN